jgi:hypothetical protein
MKNYKSLPNIHNRDQHIDGASTLFSGESNSNDMTGFMIPTEESQKTVAYESILKTTLRTLAHTADRYQGEILKMTKSEQD